MSVPTTRSGNAGFQAGPRLNKLPAIIIFVLIMLFVVGLIYGANNRNKVEGPTEQGKIFDMEIVGDTSVDFLHDIPDGLAGTVVTAGPIDEFAQEDVSAGERDMIDWLERQQLSQLQREASMRERFEERQIERYENALSSAMEVPGFDNRSQQTASLAQGSISEYRGSAGNGGSLALAQNSNPDTQAAMTAENPQHIADLVESEAGKSLLRRLGIDPESVSAVITDPARVMGQPDTTGSLIGKSSVDEDFVLDAKIHTPRGPYEIKTGHLISGAMISATNSDLPGNIVAQVTRNVYDTASGRYLLIPQGTRLFGKYDAYTALGQERLVIVWDRLVFEDGETLNIGGMQGYDGRGMSGFKDKVRTHFLRTLGNAFLISVVNASGEALVEEATDNASSNVTINLASEFADSTSSAFNEYLRNRLQIKPTLEIRAGYEFNIVVSKDVNFPRPFERGFKSYNTSR